MSTLGWILVILFIGVPVVCTVLGLLFGVVSHIVAAISLASGKMRDGR